VVVAVRSLIDSTPGTVQSIKGGGGAAGHQQEQVCWVPVTTGPSPLAQSQSTACRRMPSSRRPEWKGQPIAQVRRNGMTPAEGGPGGSG
jgi:hypothetical protein